MRSRSTSLISIIFIRPRTNSTHNYLSHRRTCLVKTGSKADEGVQTNFDDSACRDRETPIGYVVRVPGIRERFTY